MWGHSEFRTRITVQIQVQKGHLKMKVGQSARKSRQLLSAISILSLVIDS